MLGAAPTCKLYRGVLFLLAIVAGGIATLFIGSANAQAEVQKPRAHVAPVWGVALDGRQADQPNLELLAQAKAAGVNAIVTDPKRWSTERHRRLASLARGLGMFLIEPRRPSKDAGSATELSARCTSGRRVHRPCAFVATSAREAVELARRGTVDYVVVRLGSPADLEAGQREAVDPDATDHRAHRRRISQAGLELGSGDRLGCYRIRRRLSRPASRALLRRRRFGTTSGSCRSTTPVRPPSTRLRATAAAQAVETACRRPRRSQPLWQARARPASFSNGRPRPTTSVLPVTGSTWVARASALRLRLLSR